MRVHVLEAEQPQVFQVLAGVAPLPVSCSVADCSKLTSTNLIVFNINMRN